MQYQHIEHVGCRYNTIVLLGCGLQTGLPVLSLSFMAAVTAVTWSEIWGARILFKSAKPKQRQNPSRVQRWSGLQAPVVTVRGGHWWLPRWKLYNFTIEQYCDQYLVRICNKETLSNKQTQTNDKALDGSSYPVHDASSVCLYSAKYSARWVENVFFPTLNYKYILHQH